MAICTQAALTSASSPLPPVKAPVRRSETKGQGPTMTGKPGSTMSTSNRPASASAVACTTAPASAAGAVAPAWGATTTHTGAPNLMASTQTSALSQPYRSGEMTQQPPAWQKGRSRNAFSPPAIMCSISRVGATWLASLKVSAECLVVPATQAYAVLTSHSNWSSNSVATMYRENAWMFSIRSIRRAAS